MGSVRRLRPGHAGSLSPQKRCYGSSALGPLHSQIASVLQAASNFRYYQAYNKHHAAAASRRTTTLSPGAASSTAPGTCSEAARSTPPALSDASLCSASIARLNAPAPASPPRPARHQAVLPEQPFVSSLPSPATLNVEEEARAPDPPPPTVDEATEPARAPDPPIEDEATLSIAATRTMVTVETQTPIQTQKPAANPTSAKKQRPARKPAPPEAELAALDEEARRCAEIRTSLRVLTDPHNFAGAPVARADPLPALSDEPSQKLDAQKAPTLRSAHSAQRHVDRVREGIAKKAAAKTPGATRERAAAASRGARGWRCSQLRWRGSKVRASSGSAVSCC